ncbi:hypothetical protein NE237_018564 [Protea cynaroides]|uniref:Small ribosomal subunit protein uS7 domain-containing protein n=1 Tax=Protea cynaroides TaxID=273540 RepID=A0A9Q0QP17_9MAGN|nr:hypothetical protein NE237_018564 [Protea cynaroides]
MNLSSCPERSLTLIRISSRITGSKAEGSNHPYRFLINFCMKEGKRTRVRAIVYQTFHRPARTERDVIKLMVDAVEKIKPICEVEKVGVAGTLYDVPGIVARDRQQTLAIRWILGAAFKRRISYMISLEKCSFAEILDAYQKRGIARKKRENLHGLASTNRSFTHFRWWVQFSSLRLMKQWRILFCSSSGSPARSGSSGVSVETCSVVLSSEPEISYGCSRDQCRSSIRPKQEFTK